MTGPGPDRRPVLRDPALDRELDRRGYVVVDLLDAAEVSELVGHHTRARPSDDAGLTIDFVRPDRSMMHTVDELLAPMWDEHLGEHFIDFQPVVSTFVVKHPGPDSAMALHHEPTFAESGAPTFNVWIPLVDVSRDLDNGLLQLVPGSQHLDYGLVGFNTPTEFRSFEEFLREHMVSLDVAAGRAVIYDTRMLHASAANRSDAPRPAIAAAVAPAAAQLVHVVATGRRGRSVFAVDRAFFLDVHPLDAASELQERYPRLGEVVETASLTPAQVAAAVGAADPPVPSVLGPEELLTLVRPGAHGLAISASPVVEPAGGHDLPMPVGDPAPSSLPGLGVDVAIDGGEVVVVDPPPPPAPKSRWRRLAHRGDRTAPASEPVRLALGPASRCHLRTVGTDGLEMRVIECSRVAAGVACADGAAQFDNGRTVTVPAGSATLWNDGPGPLIVDLALPLS